MQRRDTRLAEWPSAQGRFRGLRSGRSAALRNYRVHSRFLRRLEGGLVPRSEPELLGAARSRTYFHAPSVAFCRILAQRVPPANPAFPPSTAIMYADLVRGKSEKSV